MSFFGRVVSLYDFRVLHGKRAARYYGGGVSRAKIASTPRHEMVFCVDGSS